MKQNPIFSGVPMQRLQTNTFDLTHDRKFSCKMGELIPILVMDVVPGDTITCKSSAFVRFAPMIAPPMHRVKVYTHSFFVPNRIVWPNWEKYITGGEDGLDATVHPHLKMVLSGQNNGNLTDHLGLPVSADSDGVVARDINCIPMAAYQLIYSEFYRDQNLITNDSQDLVDGDNVARFSFLIAKQTRAWQHDYFTSALPWTQKGVEALLPLTGEAPVWAKNAVADKAQNIMKLVTTGLTGTTSEGLQTQGAIGLEGETSGDDYFLDLNKTNVADFSLATAGASIIDLRRALRLQEYLEKNARGGSRYTEWLKVHFGVISSDKRLDRPEYLGGSATPVKISEVLNTTPEFTGQTLPVGSMAGHAVSVGSGDYTSYTAEEHGYIMTIMSVMPQSCYQQGIPKHFLRSDKFDYFTPEFQHIGEQAILNQELYNNDAGYDLVFGYTPRYAEYKFINSSVHGDYRSTFDFWHLGRKFASAPSLNEDFIEMDWNEIERIFAVQDSDDHLWCHVLNEVKAKRPMSVYGDPKL